MTDQTDRLEFPPLTCTELLNCSFSSWYNDFKQVTFQSKVIPLSTEFVDYLDAHGIFLPKEGRPTWKNVVDPMSSDDDEEEEVSSETGNVVNRIPNFPEIETAIKEAVEQYGSVFPKLNWSSPQDAATCFTASQTLQCHSPYDVFALLKTSDFITHDLHSAFEHCSDVDADHPPNVHYDLILRKWQNLVRSMEFRCFVKNGELIGICQRDYNYYGFLAESKGQLEEKICHFYRSHIQDRFPNIHYVFDVYVQQDMERVWLVDFNPFGPSTDSLLFDWEQLLDIESGVQKPEFRVFHSQVEASQAAGNGPRYATNMVPKDIIDMSQGKSIAEFAEEMQRAMAQAAYSDSEEE